MKKLLSILALIFLSALLTYAQESTGVILGKVTLAADGTPIPGVTVTLTGQVYGKSTYITTKEGAYRFWKLSPGLYSLQFNLAGLKPVTKTEIRVNVNQTTTVDVTMEQGAIEEQVTVVAQTPMIDTRKTQVSVNYTADVINRLPIALSTTEIINLAPGIMSAYPEIGGQGSSTLEGFGVRNYYHEYFLDGAAYRFNYGHGGMPASPATARLEEAQITTTGQDINNVQGGVTINFVSKRGGNKLSGEAYMAILDQKLQAEKKLPAYMSTPTNVVFRNLPVLGNIYGLGYNVNSGIYRTFDYGVSLGGPVFKDHLWFFGSWAVNDSWTLNNFNKPYARSYSPDIYGKLNAQWKTITAEFSYAHTDSARPNAPFLLDQMNSPWNVDRLNPTDTYTGQLSATLWQKLLLSLKFTYFDRWMDVHQTGLVWTGKGENATYEEGKTLNPYQRYYTYNYYKSPPYNTEATGHWQLYYYRFRRPYIVAEGNYFAERFLGGDHEIKFGFDYNYDMEDKQYYAPNQLFVSDNPATATQLAPMITTGAGAGLSYWGRVWSYYDRIMPDRSKRSGVYLQDTLTYGRVAANLGVRLDTHAWSWEKATIHGLAPGDEPIANGALDNWVGPVDVLGGKHSLKATFSPRVSLTYDLTGKGKDLLKFQYANYTGALDSFYLRAGFKSGLTRGEYNMPFIDYNGNFVPDWPTPNHPGVKNEFIINDILGHWPTPSDVTMIYAKGQAEQKAWNAAHPGVAAPWDYYTYPGWFYLSFSGPPLGRAAGGAAVDGIDSNFGPQRIREMSLSYERQWTTDISMQVIGSYKREYNLEWDRPYDGTLATKVLRSPDTSVNMGKDPALGWTVYQGQALASPAGYWVTVYKHYYNYFWGGEFILKKRYSHGWMLQASFDYQDWRVHYSPLYINADGSVNPDGEFGRSTLYDYYNKAYVGVYEYGSSEPQQNARWHYKLTGLVRLPWDLHFSLFLEGREGFLVDRWMTSYLGQNLPEFGTTRGKYRMPSFTYLNLTLDKTLRFSESVSVKLWATAYNATNAVSIQWFNANRAPLPWPIKDFPTSINRPRVVQLGVRFSFL